MPHFTVGNYGIFIFLNQEMINLTLNIICNVTVGRFSVYHIVHRIQVSFVSVLGFSIHVCGELSQDTCPPCPHAGCLLCVCCQIRRSTSILTVARCAGWQLMPPCLQQSVCPSCEHPHCLRALPSHSECQKLR